MAFAGALALAAGASAATATWIGVGVSVAFLVGSWLFNRSAQEKNQIFDPGAQEMPRFNQALRGATIPVLFGTNRVPSHITWTKNFTTIRKETDNGGGGGKFGGSGFGSKTPSGGGEVAYEYKRDLMFHIGMVPAPYNLFGGWVGSDRLNDDTIAAIVNGGESSESILFLGGTSRPRNASLSFTDAFYSPGITTGDTEFAPWSYFTTQEGTAHWWPSTAYVGFRQLSLGGQPTIPQITWEIGPGAVDIAVETGFRGKSTLSEDDTLSASTIRGDDGKRYNVTSDGKVIRLEDGSVIDTISQSDFSSAVQSFTFANGNLNGAGAAFVKEDITPSSPTLNFVCIQGSNYFLGMAASITGEAGHVFVIFKVNSSGVVEAAGAYFAAGTGSSYLLNTSCIISAGLSGAQTNSDPILALWVSVGGSNNRPVLCVLPSINSMMTPMYQNDGGRMSELVAILNASLGEDWVQAGTYYDTGGGTDNLFTGWFLPDAGGSTRLYGFIHKSLTQAHIDNFGSAQNSFIDTHAATYPDGFMFYIDLGAVVFPPDDVQWSPTTSVTICNDDFELFPFSDAWVANDGETVENNNDYWGMPSIIRLDDVALMPVWVLAFTKKFDDIASLSPIGTRARSVFYIYNSLSGQFIRYGAINGQTFDTVSDGGTSEGNRYSYNTKDIYAFYDPELSEIVEVRHTVTGASGLDDQVFVSQFGTFDISGGGDVLPPYIIYTILTHPAFGLGYSTDTIDTESYEAALDYCEAEDIRVSTVYYREEGALRIIELLLSLYGGYLVISGGKIKFGRQEVATPVRTIDNHHLVREGSDPPVKITRGAKQDAANKVKVNYIDRALEYRQNFVEIADEVDVDINGVRVREFPPQFVMSEATARKLAVRALWSGLYARDQYSFTLGPKDSDLEPGDVITLVDSYHDELSTGVYCRLTQMRNVKPGRYDCVGVTEYQQYNASSLASNSSTNVNTNILFGPALPPLDFRMYELPKEFQGANPQLYVGWVPGNFAMGARLYVSADNVSFAQVLDVQPYIIAGRLNTNLASHDGIDHNVTVHLFPTSGFNASSPTYTTTHALDDVSQAGRAVGAGLMWIGSEMVAYQGVTLLAQNYYRFDKVFRGWGGTYIHAHSAGDYWWKQGGGVFAQGFNEDKIGTTIYYKVSPYNFSGVEYNIASIDAKSYAILGTYYRPQNCSVIHTYVDTPLVGTRSEDLRGTSYKAVTSGGCMIYFDWSDASRMEGYGQGGYGAAGYGHFATDTTSHSWRVEVSSSNGFVVRSVSVSTTYYEYDRAVNSADFNGWNGAFTVRVTPYNTYGDALISGVKSLNLFG